MMSSGGSNDSSSFSSNESSSGSKVKSSGGSNGSMRLGGGEESVGGSNGSVRLGRGGASGAACAAPRGHSTDAWWRSASCSVAASRYARACTAHGCIDFARKLRTPYAPEPLPFVAIACCARSPCPSADPDRTWEPPQPTEAPFFGQIQATPGIPYSAQRELSESVIAGSRA